MYVRASARSFARVLPLKSYTNNDKLESFYELNLTSTNLMAVPQNATIACSTTYTSGVI